MKSQHVFGEGWINADFALDVLHHREPERLAYTYLGEGKLLNNGKYY